MTDFAMGARVQGDATGFTAAMLQGKRATAGLRGALVAGGAALAIFAGAQQMGAAVKSAATFQAEQVKLNTLVGISEEQTAAWGKSLRDLGPALGRTPTEMSRAMFTITSGGLRGAQALETLEQSAKASALGLGDTAAIGRAAGAAVQAFAKDNLSATRSIDVMTAIVREGNLEAGSLASTLGRVLGPAAAVGTTFEEVGAFLATYTRLGVSAEEATTALLSTINLAIAPPQNARKAMAEYGISIEEVRRIIKEDGLQAALQSLVAATEGNDDALGQMIPNVRALSGVLGTAGVQGEAYAQVLGNIHDSTGLVDEGMEKLEGTAAHAFQQWEASVEALRIELGEGLLPLATDLVRAFNDAARAIRLVLGGTETGIDDLTRDYQRLGGAVADSNEVMELRAAIEARVLEGNYKEREVLRDLLRQLDAEYGALLQSADAMETVATVTEAAVIQTGAKRASVEELTARLDTYNVTLVETTRYQGIFNDEFTLAAEIMDQLPWERTLANQRTFEENAAAGQARLDAWKESLRGAGEEGGRFGSTILGSIAGGLQTAGSKVVEFGGKLAGAFAQGGPAGVAIAAGQELFKGLVRTIGGLFNSTNKVEQAFKKVGAAALSAFETAREAGREAYQRIYQFALDTGATQEEAATRAADAQLANIERVMAAEGRKLVAIQAFESALTAHKKGEAHKAAEYAERGAQRAMDAWNIATDVVIAAWQQSGNAAVDANQAAADAAQESAQVTASAHTAAAQASGRAWDSAISAAEQRLQSAVARANAMLRRMRAGGQYVQTASGRGLTWVPGPGGARGSSVRYSSAVPSGFKSLVVDGKTYWLPDKSGAEWNQQAREFAKNPDPAAEAKKEVSARYGTDGLRDFGSGTMAMLHGREAVMTQDQIVKIVEAAARGGGGGSQMDSGRPLVVELDGHEVGRIIMGRIRGSAQARGYR